MSSRRLCARGSRRRISRARRRFRSSASSLRQRSGRRALEGTARIAALAVVLAGAGWVWGAFRLDTLDRSFLVTRIGHVDRTVAEVTAPPRHGQFELRVMVKVRDFGDYRTDEPALLELPLGRAPPQGAVIETVAEVKPPRPPEDGFDERAWLARQGIHVVLHGRPWRQIGRRGGIGGVADRLRAFVARGIAPGLAGERAALIAGVVLGCRRGAVARSPDQVPPVGPVPPPGRLGTKRRDHRGGDPAAGRPGGRVPLAG